MLSDAFLKATKPKAVSIEHEADREPALEFDNSVALAVQKSTSPWFKEQYKNDFDILAADVAGRSTFRKYRVKQVVRKDQDISLILLERKPAAAIAPAII